MFFICLYYYLISDFVVDLFNYRYYWTFSLYLILLNISFVNQIVSFINQSCNKRYISKWHKHIELCKHERILTKLASFSNSQYECWKKPPARLKFAPSCSQKTCSSTPSKAFSGFWSNIDKAYIIFNSKTIYSYRLPIDQLCHWSKVFYSIFSYAVCQYVGNCITDKCLLQMSFIYLVCSLEVWW